MNILAIDPGSEKSGFVLFVPDPRTEDGDVVESGKLPNEQLRCRIIEHGFGPVDVAVIEFTRPRGERPYLQLFEALWWAGRLAECLERSAVVERVERLDRITVKKHLTGKTGGKDGNDSAVIHALVDRFGGIGGRRAAVGLKACPGPLWGVTGDAWQALALAVTWADQQGSLE